MALLESPTNVDAVKSLVNVDVDRTKGIPFRAYWYWFINPKKELRKITMYCDLSPHRRGLSHSAKFYAGECFATARELAEFRISEDKKLLKQQCAAKNEPVPATELEPYGHTIELWPPLKEAGRCPEKPFYGPSAVDSVADAGRAAAACQKWAPSRFLERTMAVILPQELGAVECDAMLCNGSCAG
jgi:hypothetical protein